MAPIANLVVRLSAQISEFQKSFADATAKIEKFGDDFAKTAAGIGQQSTGIGSSFAGIVESAAGVAAGMLTAQAAIGAVSAAFGVAQKAIDATFGSIVAAVQHTSDLGDELFTLSQKTGLSVESLSAFKFVAAQTGTSLDTITGAVFKLESNLGAGAKKTSDALNGIGLSLKQLRSEDPAQAFTEIIAKLGELPNASARAATGVAIFGKSFKDISQLSQENLPELIKQAKDLGVVMSTETAVAADRFNDAMGVIRAGAEGLQLQIGAKLLPAVIAFAETFGTILTDAFKTAGFGGEKFTEAFDTVVVQLGKGAARILEIFALLTEGIAKWAADSVSKFQVEANAFLDLVPAFVTVGKAFDLALGGGVNQSGFDSLLKKAESARGAINSLASGAVGAADAIRGVASGIAAAASTAGDNFGATYKRIQSEISASADKMRSSLKNIGTGGVEGAAGASDAFKSFGNQLRDLTAQIDRAKQNGTPLAELVRLFGEEAAKATPKAAAWGIAVKASVTDVAKAFNAAALDKTLTKLDDQLGKFFDSRAQGQFKKLQAGMHDSAVAMTELPKTLGKLEDGFSKFANQRFEKTFDKLTGAMKSADQVAAELSNTFGKVFSRVGLSLVDDFAKGFQQGGLTGAMVSVAGGAASKFGEVFKAGMDRVAKDTADGLPGELTFGEKAAGWGAAAAKGFTVGFTAGVQNPSTLNALSSVAAGLVTAGPVGGAFAVIGFTLGTLKTQKENDRALALAKEDLKRQFHGIDELKKLAERSSFSLETRSHIAGGPAASASESVDALFGSGNANDFNKRIAALNSSLDAYNERLKAISSATDGVNARTATFAKQFAPIVAAKKTATDSGDTAGASKASQQLQELAQRTQPEFERLGLFVRDTFAGIVKETGNAISAITALAPSFQLLKDGITDFGLTSTGVIDSLMGSFDIVNNDAFKPLFENIQSTGQLFKGLFDAKALSPDTFQAAAADIGQSIQEIINRGADMAKTIALSAPQLQALWEAQQTFGAVTDQTTQSILAQAEAQGVVGEQFKSVNEKILDVLLAIGDVIGAVIPAGLRGLAAPAQEAGTAIKDSLGGAFDETAAKIDPTIGASLRGLGTPAGEAGAIIKDSLGSGVTAAAATVDPTMGAALRGLSAPTDEAAARVSSSLGAAFENTASKVNPTIGKALTDLQAPADTAASGIKDAFDNCWLTTEQRAALAAGNIQSSLTTSGTQSAAVLEAKLRGCWQTTEQRGALAAKNISDSLAGITVPDIHIRAHVDLDDIPVPTPSPLPLAKGGIVRSPTYALIGEAGPEAVVPLSKMAAFARATLGIERRSSDAFAGMGSPLFGGGIPHLATGGIATRRTLAILAESGPEAVVPLNRGTIPSPESGDTTVQMWMDGRLMGEVLLPRHAQAAKRFGLVPR